MMSRVKLIKSDILEQVSFIAFLLLITLMPMHYLLFSKILGSFKILSLWRDILVIFLTLVGITKFRRKALTYDKAIAIVSLVIITYSFFNFSIDSLNVARTYILPLLIYYYTNRMSIDKERMTLLLWIVMLTAVLVCIWGLIQAFVLGPEILFNLGYSNMHGRFTSTSFYINTFNQQRLVGTFSSPNGCGAYICITLLIILRNRDYFKKLKALYWTCVLILLTSLVATFSRSAIAAFIVGMIVFNDYKKIIKKYKNNLWKVLTIGFVCATVILLVVEFVPFLASIREMLSSLIIRTITGADTSLAKHLSDLISPATLILMNPLGLGFGTNGSFALSFLDRSSVHLVESSVWLIAYEIGVAGAIIYLYLYIKPLLNSIRFKGNVYYGTIGAISIAVLIIFILLPSVQAYEQPFYYMAFLGLFSNIRINTFDKHGIENVTSTYKPAHMRES